MAELTNLSINNNEVVDYIIEQGVTGIWTYRKYASGIAMCFGKTSGTFTTNTLWSSPLYVTGGQKIQLQYPFKFIERPVVSATHSSSGSSVFSIVADSILDLTLYTPQFQFVRTNNEFNVTSSFVVYGKWK